MKAYILAVLITGFVGAIVSLLAPEGEGGGLSRQVKFAVALVLSAVCLFPLSGFSAYLRNADLSSLQPSYEETAEERYEAIFKEQYSAAEVENLKNGICAILEEEFHISPADLEVSLRLSGDYGEERRLERIFITLYGRAIFADTGAIEARLYGLFRCQVITAVG